jgi:3-oxoacyl-[acyl-carrier-protein] synthase-3
MPVDDVYLAAVGGYVPDSVPVADAIAAGLYDPDWDAEDRMEAVAVESELGPPDMAVRAGQKALLRSGTEAGDVDVLFHASAFRQGPEFWPFASYIANLVLGGSAPAIEIRQGCNGGLMAMELARSYLQSPGRVAAMITCADRFDGDFDRWSTNKGMIFADGASAVVLSKRSGFARIVSMASGGDPSLEEMHRGDERLDPPILRPAGTLDVTVRKGPIMRRMSMHEMTKRFDEGILSVVDQALAEAKVELGDVARVLVSNLGHKFLDRFFLNPLGIPIEKTAWLWGRRFGHFANSDQFLALENLVTSGSLHEGDLVLLVGMGVGFSWTASLLEMGKRPDWAE